MKKIFIKYGLLLIGATLIVSAFAFCYAKNDNVKVATASNDEKGIQFIEQDWSKALAQAKAENKLVFLDIYASWCGPCKMLKQNTFSNDQVGEFFNKNFINVSVDGEKGVGPDLAQKYSIEGYPTLIVADSTGKPVLYTVGYMDASNLLEFAKEALKKK